MLSYCLWNKWKYNNDFFMVSVIDKQIGLLTLSCPDITTDRGFVLKLLIAIHFFFTDIWHVCYDFRSMLYLSNNLWSFWNLRLLRLKKNAGSISSKPHNTNSLLALFLQTPKNWLQYMSGAVAYRQKWSRNLR